MERASKRSRSATRAPKTAGKRKHSSKSASVSKFNKAVSKVSAARVLANAATVGFLGIEKKFLDCAIGSTAINANADLTAGEYDPVATGSTNCLSAPAQGDTEQSRDGKKIVIDSLIIKGYVSNPGTGSTAVEASSKVFVAVVLDTQTNAAQMDSEACFKNLTGTAVTNVNVLKNLLSGPRFRILKSQVFDLTPHGAFAASANYGANDVRREFDWYIPFKGGLPVNFNSGTTANVSTVVDNSIHVIAFATLAGCNIAYNSRIRFQG